MSSKLSKGFIYSFAFSFLWACNIINYRFVLKSGENALNLTLWTSLFTFLPWLFLFRSHFGEYKKLALRNILLLVFIGIASSIGISYLQSLALANTTAVNFSFLYRTIVVFTVVFASIFFKEHITKKKMLLVIFILLGSYLLTTNGQALILSKGDIYTLLMAASAAFIANILIKHTVSKMHPDLSGAVTSIVGTISLFILALGTNILKIPREIYLILLASCTNFIMIMLRNRAYKHASASFVTMIVSLTPLFVSLLSYPLLNERLEPVELVGGLIIVGSTILAEKFKI